METIPYDYKSGSLNHDNWLVQEVFEVGGLISVIQKDGENKQQLIDLITLIMQAKFPQGNIAQEHAYPDQDATDLLEIFLDDLVMLVNNTQARKLATDFLREFTVEGLDLIVQLTSELHHNADLPEIKEFLGVIEEMQAGG